jgi:acetyltransferase-like isoleucine patch superfamily enzyme
MANEIEARMRQLLSRWLDRLPQMRSAAPVAGEAASDRVIAFLRRPHPLSQRAKAAVQTLFRAELPPSPIFRLLANERFARRLLLRHLVRAAYHQPIFRTMCARAGARLLLDPGTGVPVVYGIDLILGDGVHLSGRSTFAGALRSDGRRPRLVVGDDSYLGHRLIVSLDDEVQIGAHVHIADDVYICGYDAHPMDPIARRSQPGPVDYSGQSRIVVEDDVWICQGAILLKGVRVGRGAIIGAHAVVTRDVPAGGIVAGNPAKLVGRVGGDIECQAEPPLTVIAG